MNLVYETLKTVTLDGESYSVIRYCRPKEGSLNFPDWKLGLVLEPDSIQDGVDVEEMDEDTAVEVFGRIFNVYVYDPKTNCSRF